MTTNVVDVSRSPHASLRPVPIENVKLEGGFMGRWLTVVAEKAIPHQYKMLEEHERLDRFRWASGKISRKPKTSFYPFDDTDVYKWLEACGYVLAWPDLEESKSRELRGLVKQVIDEVVAAQDSDGYLFTEHKGREGERWKSLTFDHELYCAGHLIQAAIALHRSINEEKLFNAARGFADLIANTFNPEGIRGVPGHPEVEMALVELYRETNDRAYLNTAAFFINERGKGLLEVKGSPTFLESAEYMMYHVLGGLEYFIDHKPIRELTEIVGHAVRSLYLNCGVTDLYMETGEQALLDVMNRLWEDFVYRKMYVTGAAGSRYISESFGDRYELPNERAYAETCAAIANFMWNWRMFLATGNAKHVDVMESTFYNAILSGISLDGTKYFYMNPLAVFKEYTREPWFQCACCPPNVARLIASLPGYFYCVVDDGIYVNLYNSSRARVSYREMELEIVQETKYPWNGEVKLTLHMPESLSFKIYLRIPGWCDGAVVNVDGRIFKPKSSTYLPIMRKWKDGDVIKVAFPMPVKLTASHPYVRNNISQVAIKRGPIVYCLEEIDNPVDIRNIVLSDDIRFTAKYRGDLLDGVVVVAGNAYYVKEWGENYPLYFPIEKLQVRARRIRLTAIPYYAWANRKPGKMMIWIPLAEWLKIRRKPSKRSKQRRK